MSRAEKKQKRSTGVGTRVQGRSRVGGMQFFGDRG